MSGGGGREDSGENGRDENRQPELSAGSREVENVIRCADMGLD
jgi:hypothetical protein